jgi:hypothetical protein
MKYVFTGHESWHSERMVGKNKAAGRRTLRVVCHSACEDLGTVLL